MEQDRGLIKDVQVALGRHCLPAHRYLDRAWRPVAPPLGKGMAMVMRLMGKVRHVSVLKGMGHVLVLQGLVLDIVSILKG